MESSKPGGLSCNIAFGEPRLPGEVTAEAGSLALNGHAWESLHSDGEDGTRFECQVRVIPEYGPESGEMHSANGKIRVQAAQCPHAVDCYSEATPWGKARGSLLCVPERC